MAGTTMSAKGMLFDDGPESGPATQSSSTKTEPSGRNDYVSKRPLPKQAKALSSLPTKNNEGYAQFLDELEPRHKPDELILDKENAAVFDLLVKEHRQGEQLRRHGLQPRNKILFCGPPGCGKSLAAEIFSVRTGLAFKVLRIDALISSFLGETASNLRTVFEQVLHKPSILLLDEFDAIAHTRRDNSEHNEMRRVVNTLLMLIE